MKLWKVDYKGWTVRQVEGGEWPARDEEGDQCYENTHFKSEERAWKELLSNATARVQIAGRDVEYARDGLRQAEQRAANAAVAFTAAHDNYAARRKK